jgi:hypothetical protein
VPALLALAAGSTLCAGPNDTYYRIKNLTSGSLVLRIHTATPSTCPRPWKS